MASTPDDERLNTVVEVPDVTSPEDELEQTTVDDTQGPPPHQALSVPTPRTAISPVGLISPPAKTPSIAEVDLESTFEQALDCITVGGRLVSVGMSAES